MEATIETKEEMRAVEKEAEEFIGQLEDIDEKDQPLFSPPPQNPGTWSLFSSFQEVTEVFSNRMNDFRGKWFGYQVQDPIRVVGVEKDVMMIQGVPYYTHTNTEHVFPYTSILAFDHPHKHKLNIYLPAKVAIVPPAETDATLASYDDVMKLYTHDVTQVSLPVVIHVHGGGWQRGDRSIRFYGAPYMGTGFARKGFVSVTVSYRLATKTQQHPAQIEDVARAIRWVYDHCHQFGGDKTKIFISGHSAGAHLASLISVQPNYLQSLGLGADTIKGAVLISGIYDLNKAVSADQVCWRERLFQRAYVVPTFGLDSQVWLDASPQHHVASRAADAYALPPIMLVNAASDLGLEHNARRFFELLQQQGHVVQAHTIPCTTHKTVSQTSKTLDLATEFIQQILHK